VLKFSAKVQQQTENKIKTKFTLVNDTY